ncbi:T9SS type A sorting domain-containing protein [Hymenobacter busanensis]|nr:T9SS type A sorting domain-containing protein [Hymenobacter busanensis]QHJ05850.1 T9SS type A sorting domain-containing protein [Hymenobacter busanensis]
MLAIFLLLPFGTWAQRFTETMGTTATEGQSPANYDAQGGFDNDAFAFTGSADMSVTNPSPGSGSVNVVFNPTFNNATPPAATNTLFSITDINAATITNAQVTFRLYQPAGAPTPGAVNGPFRLQYGTSTDGTTYAYTSLAYTFTGGTVDASGGRWGTAVASLPAGFSTQFAAIRFLRTAASAPATATAFNVYRVDDVVLSGTVPANITVNPDQRIFPNTEVNQVSSTLSTTVSAQGLTQNLVITAPAGFQIRTGANAFGTTVTLTPTADGTINATQLDIRFAPTAVANYNDFISLVSAGATTRNVQVVGQGTAAQPVLQTSASSLPDFGNVQVGAASSPQSFTVSGQNLGTNNITVSAPTGFQIRTGANAFSNGPITIAPTNGTVSNVQVDVRFVPVATGATSGNVQVATSGATTRNVFVSGTGTPAPTGPNITANPTTLNFGTVTNSGSSQTLTFTASGTNLQDPLVLTPSANVQIRNASAGGAFTSSPISLTPNGSGFVGATTIEVQLIATVPSPSFSGSVTLTSTNAPTQTVSITASNPSNQTSDITVSGALLREFSTSPGVPSAVQSFNISATNLLQDLTLQAPQYYQIALSPTGFPASATGNTIVLPRIGGTGSTAGDVAFTTIYVRYFPPTAQIDRGVFLTASSAPARTQFVSLNGSSAPEIELRDPFVQVRNQVKGTVSGPQAQSLRIRGARLSSTVTVRVPNDAISPLNPSGTPQFQISTSPTGPFGYSVTITPNPTNDSITSDTRLYIRYAPTRVGLAAADLTFESSNFNNGTPFSLNPNSTVRGNSIDVEPTVQSQATVQFSADRTSALITFLIPGNPEASGYGENRLVIASTTRQALDQAADFPQDGVPYDSGNERYGFGSQINGNFVVFAGSAGQVTVTNLNPNLNYYFFGFEYNNDQVQAAENYKVPNLPLIQPPLPVNLVSFVAKANKGRVYLDWVTAQEQNNRGFEVLRSRDGRNFSSIAFKEGRGTTASRSAYSHVDNTPVTGTSFYRLKQIDTDGKETLSPIQTVVIGEGAQLALFPNPVETTLNIVVSDVAADATVTVLDLLGRTVLNQPLPADGQLNLSSLKPGTYVVNVVSGGQKLTRKVVKR